MATAASPVSLTVAQLRAQIEKLQAAPRSQVLSLKTGIGSFDALFPGHGLPLASSLELCGARCSGRSSLALRAVAAAHREGKLCAWLDGPSEFYSPAAQAVGVDLPRLLMVRPALSQLAWAAQQLCRSGAFTCVVLDLTRTGVRLGGVEAKKLADAAFRGGSLLLLLTSPEAPAEGMTRLKTTASGPEGLEVEVVRQRQTGSSRRAFISWPQLFPMEPLAVNSPPLALEEESSLVRPAFRRWKASDERNGGGLHASRPGRDCAMPSLWGAR